MLTAEEILTKINDGLASIKYDRKPAGLYEPVEYVMSMGGKRMRPTLMMLAYNLFKDDPETILPSACALETYHNYTLLHDDLMDNAPLRRGHSTVHEKWNANQAILSGDTMLVMAFRQMLECNPDKLKIILELFTETALEIGEGQQYDMEFEKRKDVTEDEYIEMIRLKTSVLLACAMKMGAILADASDDDADNLYKFGEKIGLAFQLQDDYLDVYGDARVFGKAIGGDIQSNKKTFMLINAFNRANEQQREELLHWVSAVNPEQRKKLVAVTALYNEIGIDKLALKKIDEFFEEGREFLAAVNVPEERKHELESYTEKLLHRKK